MKDKEIYGLFKQSTGISDDVVSDYRPCNRFYADKLRIPFVKDAIIIVLKGNGTIVYAPECDANGERIDRCEAVKTKPDATVTKSGMMELKYGGNLFLLPRKDHKDACVVTTNGIVRRNGCAVMGAGIAKYCRDTFPGIDKELGTSITVGGNHVYYLGTRRVPGKVATFSLFSFPTKDDWKDASKPNLIRQSCREMVAQADDNGLETIYMPCPGCHNGKLDYYRDVRPILEEELDDRFVVCIPDGI